MGADDDVETFKIVNESRYEMAYDGTYRYPDLHLDDKECIAYVFERLCRDHGWDFVTDRLVAIGSRGSVIVYHQKNVDISFQGM